MITTVQKQMQQMVNVGQQMQQIEAKHQQQHTEAILQLQVQEMQQALKYQPAPWNSSALDGPTRHMLASMECVSPAIAQRETSRMTN